jgi:glucosyl-3-phosphoglycerate synthase
MQAVERWLRTRSLHHSEWPPERVAAERRRSVSVCLPARDEADTIGPIVDALMPLVALGAIDQVVVVDDSTDGTGEIARARGAEVHDQSALRGELGPVRGKGDAMWRALDVLWGEVVCYLDADSGEFGPHFACGLVGPLACEDGLRFVKAHYRRPFRQGQRVDAHGGGRVTEIMARPLLAHFYPELTGVRQPLAGEIAAPRVLLERLPFACGYGVDIGLLIDAWRVGGLDALAQVDLDVRQNRHRPLADLGPMALGVLGAVTRRLADEGRLEPMGHLAGEALPYLDPACPGGLRDVEVGERPPFAAVAA